MTQIHLQSAKGNLAKAFPDLVRLCLKQTARGDHERELNILTRRHGLDGAPTNILEELAAVHDVTRERIRQIQAKAEQRIRQLLDGSLKRKGWDICPSLRQGLVELKDDLASAGPVFSRTQFQSVVCKRFGNGVKGHWFGLFAHSLGYSQLVHSGHVRVADLNELWLPQGAVPQKSIDQAFLALNALRKQPEGLPLTTLLAELRRIGHTSIDEAVLRAIIGALPRVQITNAGWVRMRVEWLSSAADQAWHVLRRGRKALPRDEIARRINVLRVGKRNLDPMSVESIATQMSSDHRFVCSGKSGLWGLTEWGTVKDLTIVEAMEKALHAAGKPLTMNALIRNTCSLRPDASPKSVESYVNQRPILFARAGRAKVALTAWNLGLPQSQRQKRVRCSNDDFLAALELIREGQDTMPLKKLIVGVAELTGMAESTVRLRIHNLAGVRIEDRPGQRGKQICFTNGRLKVPDSSGQTKRDQLQQTIREMIEDEGFRFQRKIDLYQALNRRLPCQKTTFYRYFSEMNAQ